MTIIFSVKTIPFNSSEDNKYVVKNKNNNHEFCLLLFVINSNVLFISSGYLFIISILLSLRSCLRSAQIEFNPVITEIIVKRIRKNAERKLTGISLPTLPIIIASSTSQSSSYRKQKEQYIFDLKRSIFISIHAFHYRI